MGAVVHLGCAVVLFAVVPVAVAMTPARARAANAVIAPVRTSAAACRARVTTAMPRAVPAPRVMFTMPPAVADSLPGTAAMIAVLFAGMNSPRPTPSRASRGTVRPGVIGAIRAADEPAAIAPPRTQRRRLPRLSGSRRSAASAARANPAGSAVRTRPAYVSPAPRAVRTWGTSASGPNSTR